MGFEPTPGSDSGSRGIALGLDYDGAVAEGCVGAGSADAVRRVAIVTQDPPTGRIGATATVLSEDAYGNGPVRRTVTSLSGAVRHGDSGGPAVDSSGAVQTTVFAARPSGGAGYGVPASLVRRALASARGPVSTGPCAR